MTSQPNPNPLTVPTRPTLRLGAEVRFGARAFTAQASEISAGGATLRADRLLPEGSVVVLAMYLVIDEVEDAMSAPVEVRAKVAWGRTAKGAGPSAMGVRFEPLNPAQQGGLARLLKIVPGARSA